MKRAGKSRPGTHFHGRCRPRQARAGGRKKHYLGESSGFQYYKMHSVAFWDYWPGLVVCYPGEAERLGEPARSPSRGQRGQTRAVMGRHGRGRSKAAHPLRQMVASKPGETPSTHGPALRAPWFRGNTSEGERAPFPCAVSAVRAAAPDSQAALMRAVPGIQMSP